MDVTVLYYYFSFQHFENGEPTKSQPDPCDADPYSGSRSTKKRPAPKERLPSMPVNKMQKTLFVDQTVTEEPSTSTASLGEVASSDDEPKTEKGTQTSPQKVCGEHHGQGFFAFKSKVKCSNCGYYTVPSKEEIKHISKGSFIQTIQKNDATCFHYTGVPKVAFLLQLFIWLEPLASKIKLWDGQKKFDTSGHSAAR